MKPTDLDRDVLQGAAHELGHALVDLAGGLALAHISLNTRTGGGVVTIGTDLDRADDPGLWSAYLVGLMAGYEAERLWCARHGGHAERGRCTGDFTRFRRYRRHGQPRLCEDQARRAARAILRRDWSRVERLAPRLATEGHIRPAALGTPAPRPSPLNTPLPNRR